VQTKAQSLREVLTNTFIGLVGSWLISYICMTNISGTGMAVTVATVLCTVWSIGRGYAVRRWFNLTRYERSTIGRDMGQP
jgi:hypothetical protein